MNEINDVFPSSLSHLIGQKGVVEQVKVAIDAAFEDNRKFDSALLVGPPGVGKSALAAVISWEMAVRCHEALGQSIKGASDLNGLLLMATDKDVLFIDEAHELDKKLQTALYLAIDQRKLLVATKRGVTCLAVADFTLLLSTTDEYCLLQPLRDRMKLILRFEFYTSEELTQILRHRIKSLGWLVVDEVLPLIAQRSRGTPRLALRLLQSARRVCRSEGESTISLAHLQRACLLEQLDTLGLGPNEQKFLGILMDGPTRLNVLASIIGLPARTLSQVSEPFLLRAGLIVKDDQGRRELTALGREHLATSRK